MNLNADTAKNDSFAKLVGIGLGVCTNLNAAGCAANPACVANRGNQPVFFPGNFRYPGNIFGGIGQQSTDGSSHYNNFGPRIGFAYSPNWGWISGGPGKFSIRGGYGIYYNRGEEELTLQNLNAPPFSLAQRCWRYQPLRG